MDSLKLKLATAFSRTPGARTKTEGDYSGEQFREDLLEPAYLAAKGQGVKLDVILDGTAGYGSSFLEESFGGLARKHPGDDILDTIVLVSLEEPYLIDDIKAYITDTKA